MAFLKIDRAIADWKYWGNIYAMGIWFYVLHGANWADRYYRGVEVKRGQYLTSYRRLAEELNLDRRTIKHWLETFQKEGQIEITMLHKKTLITVINYDKYQTQNDEYVPQYAPQYVPQDVPQTVPHNVPHPNRRRIKEYKKNKNKIYRPSLDEVKQYVEEKDYHFDPEEFLSYYEARSWKDITDWKKACVTWEKNVNRFGNNNRSTQRTNPYLEMLKEEYKDEHSRNKEDSSDNIIDVQFTENN